MKLLNTSIDNPSEKERQEQIRRNRAVIDLLNAWDQEDPEEQRETVEYLMRILDEDRLSYRRLFPKYASKRTRYSSRRLSPSRTI